MSPLFWRCFDRDNLRRSNALLSSRLWQNFGGLCCSLDHDSFRLVLVSMASNVLGSPILEIFHETNVPTLKEAQGSPIWIFEPDSHEKWPGDSAAAARQGPDSAGRQEHGTEVCATHPSLTKRSPDRGFYGAAPSFRLSVRLDAERIRSPSR